MRLLLALLFSSAAFAQGMCGPIEIDMTDLRAASPSPGAIPGLGLVNPTASSASYPRQVSPPTEFKGSYYDPVALVSRDVYAWVQLEPDGTQSAPGILAWLFNTGGAPTRAMTLNNGNISNPNTPSGVVTAGDFIATDAFYVCGGTNTQCMLLGNKQNVWLDGQTGWNTCARGSCGLDAARMFVGDGHRRTYLGGNDPGIQLVEDMRPGHTELMSFVDDGNAVWSANTVDDRSGAFNKPLLELATAGKDRLRVNAGPNDAVIVYGNFDDTAGQLEGPLVIRGTNESIGGGSANYIGITLDDTAPGGKKWSIVSKDTVALVNYTDGTIAMKTFPNAHVLIGTITSGIDNGFSLQVEGTAKVNSDLTVGGMAHLGPIPLASLGTPADGAFTYCSDCADGSSPCSGGSTGAFAKRVNGAWKCN